MGLVFGRQESSPFLAQHEIRGNVEVVAQREVLPDDGDSATSSRFRADPDPLAINEDLTRRRDHVACDAAHESGLARAVLPGERNDLPSSDVQVDSGQRPPAAV